MDLNQCFGEGAFGLVYRATDSKDNHKTVAVKLNLRHPHPGQLLYVDYEIHIYRFLQGIAGIPRIRWMANDGTRSALVMDMLGPNLSTLHQ